MTNKILVYVALVLVGVFLGYILTAIHPNQNVIWKAGGATGLSGLNLKPASSDAYALGVNGTQVIDTSGNVNTTNGLTIGGTSLIKNSLIVTSTANVYGALTSSSTINGTHFVGNSGSPTFSYGAGAGTSPTTVSSPLNDFEGTLTFTASTSPSSASKIFSVTFVSNYASAPNCVIYPANATSSALYGTTTVASIPTYTTATSSITLTSGSALTSGYTYAWTYFCGQ